jgi:hypothetical protein
MNLRHLRKATHINSDRPKTPTPFDNLQIYREVSFTKHKIVQPASESETHQIMNVSGRVDYGIGLTFIKHSSVAEVQRRRRFQCFLIIVEGEQSGAEPQALAQLLVYLACLRQSRMLHNWTDASVYGVATDGYLYTFVTITHDDIFKRSSMLDINLGDLLKVLGWLKAILEITMAMRPNVTPERDGEVEDDGDLDDPSFKFDTTAAQD